jgi:3-methyladenine DNA glycosylase AlkC
VVEPFKNLINGQTVRSAREHLGRVWSGFKGARFESLALAGLEALELKARVHHLCAALEATLPEDFDRAAGILEASLAPAVPGEDLSVLRTSDAGLAGWIIWSMGEFVVRRGMAQPERALAALHALTQRSTAEFAIRPFIVAHPELSFATLTAWTGDPSAHVRRLVSEGSRPRLPWGLQLKALIADPTPTLPLLHALQDDASPYVRRSVANHLNDIARDNPGVFTQWLEQHLSEASAERRALLKHASRTLIKRGHAPVLKAWGLGQRYRGEAQLRIRPKQVALGGSVTLELTLQSSAARPQPLVIDYVVHHIKADGSTSPKVFKGWSLTLPPHGQQTLTKTHSLKPVTTRRYFAGTHTVEIQVNGTVVSSQCFLLKNLSLSHSGSGP